MEIPGSIKKKATCFMSVEATSFCFPHTFPVRADCTPSKNETKQSSFLKLLFSRIFAITIRKLTNTSGGKERGREIKHQLCISKTFLGETASSTMSSGQLTWKTSEHVNTQMAPYLWTLKCPMLFLPLQIHKGMEGKTHV